jgi:hypothetical protein
MAKNETQSIETLKNNSFNIIALLIEFIARLLIYFFAPVNKNRHDFGFTSLESTARNDKYENVSLKD